MVEKFLAVSLIGIGTFSIANPVWALSITFSSSIPLTAADVSSNFTLPRFDPSLGTLTSVDLTFSSAASGNARFENRSSRAATVLVNLSADSIVSFGSLASVFGSDLTIIPSQSYTYSVARYDGITDFSGASGRTVNGLSASTVASLNNLTTNLADITGVTDFNLPFTGFQNSSVTGSGNFDSQITTNISGDIPITYNYDAAPTPVPFDFEPSLGLSVLGGLFLGRKLIQKR